jgi:hypothetical protein
LKDPATDLEEIVAMFTRKRRKIELCAARFCRKARGNGEVPDKGLCQGQFGIRFLFY